MENYDKRILAIMVAIIIIAFAAGSLYNQKKHEKEIIQNDLILLNEDISIDSPKEEDLEPATIIVFVTGAVVSPGIYVLPKEARFYEAIEEAGGLLPDAESKNLPMARIIEDEETIYIPTVGEEVEIDTSNPLNTSTNKININKATVSDLETLNGIGPALAERIITYRNSNGPFKDISEIKNVSGIGDKKYEAIKDSISVK